MDVVSVSIGALGGLGLFLYGMTLMGNSLQKVAGKKLENIVGLLTTNRFMGVFVGAFVTAIIQSSSATTVMVVGFVNAGIMQLTQAVGVILGANIGTTVTAQISVLSVDNLAPMLVAIGVFLYLTAKRDRTKTIASIFIGLGILFFGMELLKDALKPLRELEYFKTLVVSLSSHPLLGILVGFILTFMVQSSSASIAILVALAANGALPLTAALPILYGDNIGTCTTALISSIGASRNAKRAATIHLIFNIVGTLLFVIVLSTPISYIVTRISPQNVSQQIANAHTIFNIANVVIQFPIALYLVKLAMFIFPKTEAEQEEKLIFHIDDRLLDTPSAALNSSKLEVIRMGKLTLKSYKAVKTGILDQKLKKVTKVHRYEKDINKYDRVLNEYLVKVANTNLSDNQRTYIDGLFYCVNDFERIGDHCENLADIAQNVIEERIQFRDKSVEKLEHILEVTQLTVEKTLSAFENSSVYDVDEVLKLEEEVDNLRRDARKYYFNSLNNGEFNTESGVYFLEMVNNLERITDLSSNIVRFVNDQLDN